MRPTARALGVFLAGLGLAALALTTGTDELLPTVAAVAALLLAAPVWASTRASRARSGVVIGAEAAPMVMPKGAAASLHVGVTNRTVRTCPALSVEDPATRWVLRRHRLERTAPQPARSQRTRRVLASLVAPGPLVALPLPAPGATEVFFSQIPTKGRGVFLLPAAPTWARDPLRLFAAPGPKIPTVTVVVHPRADPLATWPTVGAGASVGGSGQLDAGRGGTGDLVGIRPYVTGDRLSLLHWPARARYGTWFVRQFAPEDGATTRLVLDDRAGVHRRSDFEAMLSTAQGLVDAALSEDRPLELCTLSGSSTHLSGERCSYEEAVGVLASLRPRQGVQVATPNGIVLTTATGARTLPGTAPIMAVGA
ncbi:MAG TPA: DUF58 domain-containing protein [Acidimicrobiales bacterium]|nr:DUF58 domain-containing protein [Acidimicrobiales bacterium]